MTFDRAAEFLRPRLVVRPGGRRAALGRAGSAGSSCRDGGVRPVRAARSPPTTWRSTPRPGSSATGGTATSTATTTTTPSPSTRRSSVRPGNWDQLEAFRNPPFYALLYTPTAGLPYFASALIWNVVVARLSASSGVRLARGGAGRGGRPCGRPRSCRCSRVVGYGQNSLLSFAVFAGTYRLLANGRPFAAGLVAGLLWFKPPLLIGLVVVGPPRPPPALAGRGRGGSSPGPLLVARQLPARAGRRGPGSSGDVPRQPARSTTSSGGRPTTRGRSGGSSLPGRRPRRRRGTGLTILCVAGRAGRVRPALAAQGGDDLPAVFGAAVALTLWASPHVMIYEWAVAVVPAVLWWEHDRRHRPAWIVLFAVAWVAFFAATDFNRAPEWAGARSWAWTRRCSSSSAYPSPGGSGGGRRGCWAKMG